MHKIDQYRRGMELCLANAVKAPFSELGAVWQTLGKSYAFLAELESWPGFAVGEADGHKSARSVQRFNNPIDDRILP
ncbi:MAG TPA: hypothetical protein VE909_00050 [Xanthobacteraceae bacterium]|nr:hypothetical protein [Xanthobacteraceae bacterium]